MTTTLIEGETQCVIRIEGNVDIEGAAELKAMLLAAISSGKGVQINLEGASDLDVTAVQLLWSAAREAAKASSFVAVHVPEHIRCALREMGLRDFPSESAVTASPSPVPAEERR